MACELAGDLLLCRSMHAVHYGSCANREWRARADLNGAVNQQRTHLRLLVVVWHGDGAHGVQDILDVYNVSVRGRIRRQARGCLGYPTAQGRRRCAAGRLPQAGRGACLGGTWGAAQAQRSEWRRSLRWRCVAARGGVSQTYGGMLGLHSRRWVRCGALL